MKCLWIRDDINNILYIYLVIIQDIIQIWQFFFFFKKNNINTLKHKILYCPIDVTTLKLKHE